MYACIHLITVALLKHGGITRTFLRIPGETLKDSGRPYLTIERHLKPVSINPPLVVRVK